MKHSSPDKIIFLDVDGVICTEHTRYHNFCPADWGSFIPLEEAKLLITKMGTYL